MKQRRPGFAYASGEIAKSLDDRAGSTPTSSRDTGAATQTNTLAVGMQKLAEDAAAQQAEAAAAAAASSSSDIPRLASPASSSTSTPGSAASSGGATGTFTDSTGKISASSMSSGKKWAIIGISAAVIGGTALWYFKYR